VFQKIISISPLLKSEIEHEIDVIVDSFLSDNYLHGVIDPKTSSNLGITRWLYNLLRSNASEGSKVIDYEAVRLRGGRNNDGYSVSLTLKIDGNSLLLHARFVNYTKGIVHDHHIGDWKTVDHDFDISLIREDVVNFKELVVTPAWPVLGMSAEFTIAEIGTKGKNFDALRAAGIKFPAGAIIESRHAEGFIIGDKTSITEIFNLIEYVSNLEGGCEFLAFRCSPEVVTPGQYDTYLYVPTLSLLKKGLDQDEDLSTTDMKKTMSFFMKILRLSSNKNDGFLETAVDLLTEIDSLRTPTESDSKDKVQDYRSEQKNILRYFKDFLIAFDRGIVGQFVDKNFPCYSHKGYGERLYLLLIHHLSKSFRTTASKKMRHHLNIPHNSSFAVVIQQMLPDIKYLGAYFTHDPDTGKRGLSGTYTDVTSIDLMAGKDSGKSIKQMDAYEYSMLGPHANRLLADNVTPREIEFMFDSKSRFLGLQVVDMRFSPEAQLNRLRSQFEEGNLSIVEYSSLVNEVQSKNSERIVYQLEGIPRPEKIIAKSQDGVPGAMEGVFVESFVGLSVDTPVVLYVSNKMKDQVLEHVFKFNKIGLIYEDGNNIAHETVLLREAGISAVFGIENVSELKQYLGRSVIVDGDNKQVVLSYDDVLIEEKDIAKDGSFGVNIVKIKKDVREFISGIVPKLSLDPQSSFESDVEFYTAMAAFYTKKSESAGNAADGFFYMAIRMSYHAMVKELISIDDANKKLLDLLNIFEGDEKSILFCRELDKVYQEYYEK
jgi:hypothetical protein